MNNYSIDINVNENQELVLTADNDFVREMIADTGSINYRDWFEENMGWDLILWECLEPYLCNGWSIVPPEEIGALTSATIITDNNGNYWYDNWYDTKDCLEDVLTHQKPYKFTLA